MNSRARVLAREYSTESNPVTDAPAQSCSRRLAALLLAFPRKLLWFAFVLLVGGGIFSALEQEAEVQARRELATFLSKMHHALDADDFHELVGHLGRMNDRVAEEMANLTADATATPNILTPHDWDFAGACFFCFTAATTIGYGNYTPQTSGGKLFLVIYAVVAIPACLSAFAEASSATLELLAARFQKRMVYEQRIDKAFHMFDADRSGKLDRFEVRKALRLLGYDTDLSERGRALSERFEEGFTACDPDGDGALDLDEFRRFVHTAAPDVAAKVDLVLSKGYVVLIASGLFLLTVALSTLAFSAFYKLEEWSALDAFYFTIVSFTTIGFGDFSPDPHPGWFAAVFIAFTFVGLLITATLVRAASDPSFDSAAMIRGLLPKQWDYCVGCREAVVASTVDTLRLPTRWRGHATPIFNSRHLVVGVGAGAPSRAPIKDVELASMPAEPSPTALETT